MLPTPLNSPNAETLGRTPPGGLHLNLLKMTAMMRRTRMVMMEMVIMRFVAILSNG